MPPRLQYVKICVAEAVVLALVLSVSLLSATHRISVTETVIRSSLVFNHSACSVDYCSGRGICFETATSFRCNCSRWFYGEHCNESCPEMCSGRGDCVVPDITGALALYYQENIADAGSNSTTNTSIVNTPVVSCLCPRGFGGIACQISCPLNCSNRGNCSLDGVCSCDAGYAGEGCQLECPNRCSGAGFCYERKNRNGEYLSHSCVCNTSFGLPDCVRRTVVHREIVLSANDSGSIVSPSDADKLDLGSTVTYIIKSKTVSVASGCRINGRVWPTLERGQQSLNSELYSDQELRVRFEVIEPKSPFWALQFREEPCYNSCPNCTDGRCCASGSLACLLNTSSQIVCTTFAGINENIKLPAPWKEFFKSDWKPLLPQANPLPALFQREVKYQSPLAKSPLAIAAIFAFLGVYVLVSLIVFMVNMKNRRTLRLMQANAPVAPALPPKKKLSFISMWLTDHLVIGAFAVGTLERFSPIHRLTVCAAQLLASLTFSAVWHGTQSSLGNYIATSFVAGLIMTPLEIALLVLFRRPAFHNLQHKLISVPDLQDYIAFATGITLIAWCSYVSVFFAYDFGPIRSKYWLISFAISVFLQLTLYHTLRTGAKYVFLRILAKHAKVDDPTMKVFSLSAESPQDPF